ncbi:hypothetical protein F5Y10DRAFT_293712 [Nemania abortiva]|nr:hypothetical protein F5Y10DRAFT_293712 [Nemania abortiva]
MDTPGSTSGTSTGRHGAVRLVTTPRTTNPFEEGTEITPSLPSRVEGDNSIALEGTAISNQPTECAMLPLRPIKKSKGNGGMRKKLLRITDAHENLLAAAKEGTLDVANIRGMNELFELGTMESSILHLVSERWSTELEPFFRAVMTEASEQNDDTPKLYLLKDCLDRTIINRSTGHQAKVFVGFLFKNYTKEALEIVKSDPELLVFLLSALRRKVDWSLICRELRELLPKPLKDEHRNTFLHRVIRFPLESRHIDDGELVKVIISKVIEAEPSTLFALNGQGKSVYEWCMEAVREGSDSPLSISSSDDEPDRTSDSDMSDSDMLDSNASGRDYSDGSNRHREDGDGIQLRQSRNNVSIEKQVETTSNILLDVSNLLKERIFRLAESADQIRQLISTEDKYPEFELDFSEYGDIKHENALSQLITLADLKIGTLLRSVKLPANKTNEPESLKARQSAISNLFAQIKNVESTMSIVYLVVDESIDHPCSDDMIESSLSGIEVDTLDWRKTDMHVQVIVNAVPHVQCLHLYSSGNQGILLSWSAPDALPSLLNLKKVIITFLEDQASPRELITSYINEFRRRLDKNIGSDRQIEIQHSIQEARGITWSPVAEPVLSISDYKKTWMKSLKEFCGHVSHGIDSPQSADSGPLVAIVADGVNMAEFQAQKPLCVVRGQSFISTPSSCGFKSWFFSTTGRGTVIARIILSMNPNVRFLVARTDISGESRENSVAKALEWCVDQRADIICLGTAVGNWRPSERPYKSIESDLTRSLDLAIEREIVVLMPTIERSNIGQSIAKSYLRVNQALTIAASRWYKSVELPPPEEAKFTLIDDVPEELGGMTDEEGTSKVARGDFVSTAIAAGLATSITTCVKHHNSESGSVKASQMELIFKSLLGRGESRMIRTTNLTELISKFPDQTNLANHLVGIK